MGWELRHGGKWYLYRNRRANGRRGKEDLATEGDFGSLKAQALHRLQARQRKVRNLTRKARDDYRDRSDGVVTGAADANTTPRAGPRGPGLAGLPPVPRGE